MEIIYISAAALIGALFGELPPIKRIFDKIETAAKNAAMSVQFDSSNNSHLS